MPSTVQSTSVDVLIIGAGISGIGAAYHLQTKCPGKTYAILEARERLGGTWDLFRYPGVRSDSDMYTLGFSFRPWRDPQAIADGPAILKYLRDTAEAYGIDRQIRFRHKVESASFSTATSRWTVEVRDLASGAAVRYSCRFLFACAGYYDYDDGYTPPFADPERFRGRIVHPQRWPEELDCAGKRVVVIGSGATAVTLVPALAAKGAQVTMLQRSPTYILSAPGRDPVAGALRAVLPARAAYAATRWKNVLLATALYRFCRRFPKRARSWLIGNVRRQVGSGVDVDRHFNPTYAPWDQRLCLVPDGDLFRCLREGKATIVTDRIERFTERGLRLASGQELEADVIVTATGLKVKFLGGVRVEVDGKPFEATASWAYKGMMLSDVPNLALAVGYTNASWTLKVDLVSEYVCRLINHMDANGYTRCVPRRTDPTLRDEPLVDLASGYVERAAHLLPRQGSALPWKLHQSYLRDLRLMRRGPLEDGAMEFS